MNRDILLSSLTKRISALTALWLVLLLSAGTWARPVSAASGVEPGYAAVDAYVAAELQAVHIPGAALSIVHGDQTVFLKGYGIADPSGRAVTPQTPFLLGSVSKSFTALAIMQLVEAGKVELDAPVQRYLPWFRVADPAASQKITLRQLLNQTSGLSKATGLELIDSADQSAGALDAGVRDLSTATLTHPVGVQYEYSNANYAVLGLIVQAVSGQPYETYIQQNVFTPLGMRQSFTSAAEARPHGLAAGYQYWFGQPVARELPYPRALVPAGFLASSAEDMTHYLIAQLNGGRYGGAAVLSPAGIAELHRPAAAMGVPGYAYAMGWYNATLNGLPVVIHDGDTSNFFTYMMLVPDGNWGVALLMNASNAEQIGRVENIAVGVASLLTGRQPLTPPPASEYYGITFTFARALAVMIALSAFSLWRWQAHPERRLAWWRLVWQLGMLPLIYLFIAWLFLFSLPQTLSSPLPQIVFRRPDLGWTAVVTAAAAIGWGLASTFWAIRLLRRSGQSALAASPIHALRAEAS